MVWVKASAWAVSVCIVLSLLSVSVSLFSLSTVSMSYFTDGAATQSVLPFTFFVGSLDYLP